MIQRMMWNGHLGNDFLLAEKISKYTSEDVIEITDVKVWSDLININDDGRQPAHLFATRLFPRFLGLSTPMNTRNGSLVLDQNVGRFPPLFGHVLRDQENWYRRVEKENEESRCSEDSRPRPSNKRRYIYIFESSLNLLLQSHQERWGNVPQKYYKNLPNSFSAQILMAWQCRVWTA